MFKYAYYWSDQDTWGGDYAPIEGESVLVPSGMNLVVDNYSPPILNAVIVQGSLVFLP